MPKHVPISCIPAKFLAKPDDLANSSFLTFNCIYTFMNKTQTWMLCFISFDLELKRKLHLTRLTSKSGI